MVDGVMLEKSLDGFMEDFRRHTEPDPFGRRGMRVLNRCVLIEVHNYFRKFIYIASIWVVPEVRLRGHGSIALEFLTKLADKYHVDLQLVPQPLGTDGPKTMRLRRWYSRHGFRWDVNSKRMLRKPLSR